MTDPQNNQAQPAEVNGQNSNINSAAAKHPAPDAPAVHGAEEPPSKKTKIDDSSTANGRADDNRRRGFAPVKPECVYRLSLP